MDAEKAIKGIMVHRKAIHAGKQWSDPLGLSETMLKLATYNAYLADNIAGLHHDATESHQSAYKSARELENTQGDAEMLAKYESLDKRTSHERVKYVYESTKNLISVLQTRLKAIQNAMQQEGGI